jgi:hypothetical protein
MSPRPTATRSTGRTLSIITDFPTVNKRGDGEFRSDCAGEVGAVAGVPSVCWAASTFTNKRIRKHTGNLIVTSYHASIFTAYLRAG